MNGKQWARSGWTPGTQFAAGCVALTVLALIPHVEGEGLGAQEIPEAETREPIGNVDAQELAYIRLVVEAAETTATGTASTARFRARTVVAALESSGVTLEQIDVGEVEMTSVTQRPRVGSSRRPAPPPRVIGYRGWVAILVTTPATRRVDFVVDRAAGAGAVLEWVEYGREGDDPPGGPAPTEI